MSIRGTLAIGLVVIYSLILMATNGAADWAWLILAAAAAMLFIGRSEKAES